MSRAIPLPVREFRSQNACKWCVVALLWFVCFLNYADRQAVFALFPLLRAEFHLSDMQLALAGSSFMWMYAAFGPVAGWMGDRFSRRGLILAGLACWLGMTLATIMARRYWQLTVLRGLGGIAEAVYFPAAMSLISSYHGVETRSRAMSAHQSAVYVGTVGGGVLAALIGEHFGWRSSFVGFGNLGLLLLFVLLIFLKEPPRTHALAAPPDSRAESPVRIFAVLLSSPLVLRLIAAFICANFVAMVFMVWLPTFFYSKFHMSLARAGTNATVYLQLSSIAGVLTGGFAADMLAQRSRGGRMLTQAFGLLGGVAFLFLAGWTFSVQVLIAGMTGFGFCKGIYESNLWASLYDVVQPEQRAAAVGIMNSLGWLGGGIAPLAIAAGSRRFGMSACLSATSLVYLFAAGILLWTVRVFTRPGKISA